MIHVVRLLLGFVVVGSLILTMRLGLLFPAILIAVAVGVLYLVGGVILYLWEQRGKTL